MDAVSISGGDRPIILAQPHSGTFVPDDVFSQLNSLGKKLLDTDWHIPILYDGLVDDVTIVRANFSRYVIDANRDPQGTNLYPGQNTTDLVPLSTFDGKSIWLKPPSEQDIENRLVKYHSEYHRAIEIEIERLKLKHKNVLLYDCHSIRSEVSHLFAGVLPHLNIGTNSGESCAKNMESVVENVCQRFSTFSHVVNGRFKGGWTTRHYGRPSEGVHALQMEIAQRSYLSTEAPPFAYDDELAGKLRVVLKAILSEITMCLTVANPNYE